LSRHEFDREREPLQCPQGHSGADIVFLATNRDTVWPACVRCLSNPVPDEAQWNAKRPS
jgi:hypothetical protein